MSGKNVVFLVLDSLRKDRTSIYNNEIDFTPNLESIADSSIVFENSVSQAPWTLPSHASIFTGKYPWKHGVKQSRTYMGKNQETFIQDFNIEGYTTAAITPNVWITPHKGTAKDFDQVENFLGKADNRFTVKMSKISTKIFDSLNPGLKKRIEKYLDKAFRFFSVDDSCKSEETVEEVEKFLSEREDENFFLYVNLMEPHEPYHPPEKYMKKHGIKDKSNIPQRQKDLFTKEIDYSKLNKIYDASADYTDDLVGRITDSLKENNLEDETVLVVISDHGQALGEDDIFGHQFTVDDSVTDTVMMIKDSEEKSRREKRLIELRKLHELIPYHANIGEKPDKTYSEKALGAYDFPSVFIGYVPEDKWSQYFKKYHYVKTTDFKAVKEINSDEEENITTLELKTGKEVDTPPEIEETLEKIGKKEKNAEDTEENKPEPDQDEEIKKRLEELGYS